MIHYRFKPNSVYTFFLLYNTSSECLAPNDSRRTPPRVISTLFLHLISPNYHNKHLKPATPHKTTRIYINRLKKKRASNSY